MPGLKSLLLVALFGHGGSSHTLHGHTPDRDPSGTNEISSRNYKDTTDGIEQDVMSVTAAETCNFTTGAKVAEHMNNILVSPIYLQLPTVPKQLEYLHLQTARYVDLIKTCKIIDEEALNALVELMDVTAELEVEEGVFDCKELTSNTIIRKELYRDHCSTLNHSNILQYLGVALNTAAFQKMDTDRQKMCYAKRVVERFAGMIGACEVRDEDIDNAMDELLDYCRVLGVEETMKLADCDTLTKCLEKPAESGFVDESSTDDLKHESKEFDLKKGKGKHGKKEISAGFPTTEAPTKSEVSTATPKPEPSKSETKKTSLGRDCTDFTVTKVMDHIDATTRCNVYQFLKTDRMKACFVQFAIDRFEDIVKSCAWKTENVRYAIDALIDFGQILMTGEGIDRDYCEKNRKEVSIGEASLEEEWEGSGGVRGHHLVDEDDIDNLNTLISEVYELISAQQEEKRGKGKHLLL